METLIKLIQTLVPNGVIKVNTKGNGINIINLSSSVIDTVEDTVSQLNKELSNLGSTKVAKFFDKNVKKSIGPDDSVIKTEFPALIAICVPKVRTSDADKDLLASLNA